MNQSSIPVANGDIIPEPEDPGIINRVFNYQTLSSLLRILGSGVLVASLSILLFRGWDANTDIIRYFTILAFGGFLAAIGVVMGKVVKENKGARTFLALAIGAVAVNFTVLGALAYSLYDPGDVTYPGFASWIGDPLGVVGGIAAALLILTPVTYLGFSVFARQSAKRFTVLYILGNIALLLPFRASLFVGLIALALAIVIIRQIVIARANDSALATREGHFVIGAQFLPLLILLGRNIYIHAADEFILTVGSAIAYLMIRQFAIAVRRTSRSGSSLLNLSQTAAAVAVALGATALATSTSVSSVLILPVFAITLAGLLVDISFIATSQQDNYGRAAAIVFAGGLTLNLFAFPGFGTALSCIAAGLVVAIYGYSVEKRSVFLTGLAALVCGLIFQLHDIAQLFVLGHWSSLAAVGIIAIVTASLLERYGVAIRKRVLAWRAQFSEWDY